MNTFIKNESLAKSFKSRGAAISRGDNSKDAVVAELIKAELEPVDIGSNVQFILTTMASGMTKVNGYAPLELLKVTDKELDKAISDKTTAKANTTDKAKKEKIGKDIAELRDRKAARKTLKSKISHEPRDFAAMLITAYKKRLKQKLLTANKKQAGYTSNDANLECDALGYEMKQACKDVFSIKLTKGEQKFSPDYVDPDSKEEPSKDGNKSDSKAKGDSWKQQVTNALNALQSTDNPPANINKLVAELSKALEPSH